MTRISALARLASNSNQRALAIALLAILSLANQAFAQPQIGSFEPRALQLGSEQIVVVQGSNYDGSTRLVSDLNLIQRIVDMQPGRVTIAVAADGLPGVHPVWIATDSGLSSSVLVAVDSVPTIAWQDTLEQLPIALYGDLRGNVVQRTSFPVLKGQRVAIEVESRRLGAALQPVVRVFDHSGRQVAAATPDPRMKGDCRTQFIADADTTLTLELSDLLRRGATPGTFRLKIGDFAIADSVLPLAISPREELPQGWVLDHADQPALLPRTEPFATWLPAIVGSGNTAMLPLVRVVPWNHFDHSTTSADEILESPVSFTGALSRGETQRARVRVPSGQRVSVELWSYRLGIEGDFVVDVRTVSGQSLGRVDDVAGSRDPKLEIAVPADQTEVDIFVSELLGNRESTPYLFEVLPLDTPRINALLDTDHVSIGRNRVTLAVPIVRSNYAGEITLKLEPEIPGIHVESLPSTLASDRALVQLWSDAPFADQVVRIVAHAGEATTRARRGDSNVVEPRWLAESIAISYIPSPAFDIALQLAASAPVWQGANVRVPLSVTRPDGLAGAIRVSLETGQKMPRKTVRQDNQDREVDAVERAIRLESSVTIPAENSEAELVLMIPTDLAEQAWNLAVVAELLSADGNTVLARSSSPLLETPVRSAMAITVTSNTTIGFLPGSETPVVIEGTLERRNGFAEPVIITLDGLPGMTAAPEVEVAPGVTSFRVELRVPAESKLEEWGNVSIVARSWDADGYLQAESLGTKLTFQVPQ